MAVKKTTEEFNKEVQDKFGTDISVYGEYLGAQRNVSLICSNGHIWETLATNLISRGSRSFCNICKKGIYNRVVDWNADNILKLKDLVSRNTSLDTIASNFGSTTASILNACSKYNISRPKVDSTVLKLCDKLLEQDRELVSSFDTITSSKDKVTIKCSKGHIHEQNIYNIINDDTNCPSCFFANGRSKAEIELADYITKAYKGTILYNTRPLPGGKEIDLILPDLHIAFEYNGTWFHREEKVGKRYHLDKQIGAKLLGYQLFHIFEDEWELKKEIVKARIDAKLGRNLTIYARKCIIKEIDFPANFLDENHLQGAGQPTKYNYGLFSNNELVAVMTFASSRFDKAYNYELVRYTNVLGVSVVGGASKLLKYFRQSNPGTIISYSDKRWSDGNLYKQLGFMYIRTSEPGYKYYKRLKSFSRHSFQKHKLQELFPNSYSDNKTEKEIMSLEGYHTVYDCGNDVWTI